ncbi:MAG TPA: NADPH-dependent glutamate synthase [Myxococcota bacterium]|nr:NADPH-dependent glutamate synthase [Myxococcota bacterium]HPV03781.1 NADPH-dependent glutamate synthase [Myxococcota bacterium]
MAEKLTPRQRLAIPPVPMREQDPGERRRNIREVPFGYSAEEAMLEASRCLLCRNKPCIDGCPVAVDIPGFIELVSLGLFNQAAELIRKTNCLPAVCGRVCPQEEQCQAVCTVAKSHKDPAMSVQIGKLERFVADWDREHPVEGAVASDVTPTGRKVAIIGSGPGGLTAAGDLADAGHEVTVFEALHRTGGVLVYGIPEFRLPKDIVEFEVDGLVRRGVRIVTNVAIGKSKSIDDLFAEGYDAVFIATGAGLPWFKNIPGEDSLGVYSANEYLTRANLMDAYRFGDGSDTPIMRGRTVVTFGGGNVAMDAARTALRLGADESIIVYRRSLAEMPARLEEIHHAQEEGVRFELLQDAVEVVADDAGWVTGVRCQKMALGEPDRSGRPRPVPIEGSEFVMPCSVVICAIGNGANPILTEATPAIETGRWGNIVADPVTGRTSMKGVWAGGDIVRGGATVILAMGDGRRAAASINEYLQTGVW